MNLSAKKKLIGAAAVLLVVIGLASCLVAVAMPLSPAIHPPKQNIEVAKRAVRKSDALPSLDQLRKVAGRDIRQRLFDPPPPPPVQKKPKPMPEGRLVGTVLNGEKSSAMIASGRGEVKMLKVGERIGNDRNFAVIKVIRADRVIVEHDGSEKEIIKQESK